MAETDVTQGTSGSGDVPAAGGNEVPASDSPGTEPSQTTPSSEPAEEPYYKRYGAASPEEFDQTFTRYKQQVQGSQAEFQRLQREIQQRDASLQAHQQLLQQVQAGAQGGRPATPTYQNLAQAYEAYLGGDAQALDLFQAQQEKRVQDSTQSAVVETLTRMTKPAQYAQLLVGAYADMDKPDSDLYRRVWDAYDQYAPQAPLLFGQDPAALKEMPSPDGGPPRQVDLRMLRIIAADKAKELEFERGRREEARRRNATGGDPVQQARRTAPSEPPAWEQLTPEEQRSVESLVTRNITPPGWPRVQDTAKRRHAFAKHLVDRRKAREAVA